MAKLFGNVNLKINYHVLERVDECIYLGLIIDREFSCTQHIDYTSDLKS